MKKSSFIKNLTRLFIKPILVQLMVALVFVSVLYISMPALTDDICKTELIVDEIEYNKFPSGSRVTVHFNSDRYIFSNVGRLSNREIYNKIQKGDRINITYVKRLGLPLFNEQRWIVEAHTKSEELYSINEYNSEKKLVTILVVVIFIITETLLIWIFRLYFLIHSDS